MGLRIQEGGEVLKGVPVVQLSDHLFWFNRPRLILYLINFILFQNAFQLAFLAWSWPGKSIFDLLIYKSCLVVAKSRVNYQYEFSIKSCFHEHIEDIIIRITMG
ncbi:hypothetical protein EZV62_002455 [Acer yangbiense]|uniref:Uncharacterized protein n=1 Tax=Acer yangbiense TaxID=1000413 RepID=A0A5C7IZN0_9ROSI|nr:hypothetical protein EZV62_002455 [Acer yangbiense]